MSREAGHLLCTAISENFVWTATVLVVILAVAVAAIVVVKFLFGVKREKSSTLGPVFSLVELRRLREQGQVSDEEYKLLKEKISKES